MRALQRVLTNLFENATRHGRSADGRVRIDIQVARRGEWIELEVRDHGLGTAPDALPRLTDPLLPRESACAPRQAAAWGWRSCGARWSAWGRASHIRNAPGGGLSVTLRLRPA